MLTRTIHQLTTKFILLIGTSLALVAGGAITFVAKSAFLPNSPQPPARLHLQTSSKSVKFSAAIALNSTAAAQTTARPLTLATADFDEDGTPDLIGGFANENAGLASLYRGNVEATLPTQKTTPNAQAFFPAALNFALPTAPDFLVTGDFNADGHFDVIAATRHQNKLYLLAGDGAGNFAPAQTLELSGGVTTLAAGEMNRVDGLADVAVGVNTPNGAQAVLYAAAEGAWTAQAKPYDLAQPATSFAFGQLTRDAGMDLAIAAGSELVILEGGAATPKMTRKALQFAVEAVAIGRFTDNTRVAQVAMLARGGSIYVAQDNQANQTNRSRSTRASVNRWQPELMLATGAQTEAASATQLLRAHVSASAKDDLLLVGANQINIVTNRMTPELVAARLENQTDIAAALPLRVSSSARDGLVFLSSKQPTPFVVAPEVAMTFTVNSNTDADDSNPGDGVCSVSPTAPFCGLRAAIQEANANVGQDTIRFNIGAGTQQITVGQGLPPITESLIIDGTPPAGAPADQSIVLSFQVNTSCRTFVPMLDIRSNACRVRGLTITQYPCGAAILLNTGTSNNLIDGNNLVSNGGDGVTISGSSSNTIGGTTTGSRNVIAANTSGIALRQITATQNTIVGNYIGTNAAGTAASGNFTGIDILLSENNTIGGTTAGARNVISGNSGEGIAIVGFQFASFVQQEAVREAANNNLILGNYIGVDASGFNSLGNGLNPQAFNRNGVRIFSANGTTIGGAAAGAANIIANNGGNGVFVEPQSTGTPAPAPAGVSNAILGNSIRSNAALGIDLGATGITANDPGDGDTGANNLQNYPILTAALTRTTGTTVIGTLNSTANSTFTIELFNNAACDPSGNGEGEAFLARTIVTTNAAGLGNFSVVSATPLLAGRFITATATDASGNTSEFSACRAVQNAIVDLNVAQTVAPTPILVGNNLAYNVTVTNSGPDDATGVTLTNAITIPGGQFTIVSVTPSQGTCTGTGPISCSLGTIAAAANATVRIVLSPTIPTTGTPPNSVTVTNTATASSNELDSLPPNNTNATSATVNASADLAIAQTVTPNPAASGSVVTYTITITNNGPSTASNVSGRFDPSLLLTNVTCTAPAGSSCNRDGNPFFTSTPTLAPGTAVFILRGTLNCLAQNATLTNTVTVSSGTADVNPANNTSTINSAGQSGAAIGTIAYDAPNTTALALGPVVAGNTVTPPSGTFTLTNTGCLPMNLTTAQFIRAGNTANLTGLDDSRFFSLRLVPTTGAEIPLNPTANPDRNAVQPIPISRTLQSGQSLRFRVVFNPPLPFFAGFFTSRDQQLFANQVLPDLFDSRVLFNFITGGQPLPARAEAAGDPGSVAANIVARVSPAIQIIARNGNNSADPSTAPLVLMDTVRGDFRVRVSLYDANKNATRITYQFFDTFRQPATNPLEINLSSALSASALLPGQPFTLQQDFSGASARPDIVYVRVTVTDADGTTVSASSNPLIASLAATGSLVSSEAVHSDVLTLPAARLGADANTDRRQTDSHLEKEATKAQREN